jgi:hypothetical protein
MAASDTSGVERFVAEVFAQAGRLGLPWWQAALFRLAVALLAVVGRSAFVLLHAIEIPAEWDPERGTGSLSPPMPMPPGGLSVPGPTRKDGDP